MSRFLPTTAFMMALSCSLASGSLTAGPAELDRAVERYYAGYPGQAIAMLEPLALAGDADAQYLLGNIVYALARSGLAPTGQDPTLWYRMAAEQGSAEASYALGVIYNNRWLEKREAGDAHLAEHYYQHAADLGYTKAEAPLLKLAARNRANREYDSRVYTNADFATATTAEPGLADETAASPTRNTIADFAMTGDPIADANRLQNMLSQLGDSLGLPGGLASGEALPDEATLSRVLTSFGADPQLIENLGKLLEHFRAATEHSLAPGAN